MRAAGEMSDAPSARENQPVHPLLPDPGSGSLSADPAPSSPVAEWMLQADAAEAAGCSVSAIRKWRREGVVGSRRSATAGGLERVEVRLADVEARAGERRRSLRAPQPRDGAPVVPPGMVMIPMPDLEALFQQVRDAGQRANDAERRLRESGGENRLLREQVIQTKALLGKVRDDLEEERRRARPAGVPDRGPRAPTGAATAPRQAPPGRAPGAAPNRPPLPEPAIRPAGTDPGLGPLASELRRLYARLQAHQRATPIDPAEERRWAAELAAYDQALQAACGAMGLVSGPRTARRLDGTERVRLTRDLAAAGLDVRVK